MKQYRTVKECLDAIGRGFIVDAKDNRVPAHVVKALAKKDGVQAHIRYEHNQEIWWFY